MLPITLRPYMFEGGVSQGILNPSNVQAFEKAVR